MSLPDLQIKHVGLEALPIVRTLNKTLFHETRVINRFDRRDLTILLAYRGSIPVGFKMGYGLDRKTFYSAKGGVLELHRRQGIARDLLYALMGYARKAGYQSFAFDTFPNRHAGMTILGLIEGFRIVQTDFNNVYKDFRIRFEKRL